jgi:hypothetical protein
MKGATMAIKANMVLTHNQGQCEGWMREMLLPIPPFPGLGIRIDTYKMLNVEKLVIENNDHDVTCFVTPEGADLPNYNPINAGKFGFYLCDDSSNRQASPKNLLYIDRMQKLATNTELGALQTGLFLWNDGYFLMKTIAIPFPPFVGLEFRLDETRTHTVCSIVIGDFFHDVTCITENKGIPLSSAEFEALGFEEAMYPY